MALIYCPECNKQISSSAACCPNCGHSKPAPKKYGCGTVILIGVIWFSIVKVASVIDSEPAKSTQATATKSAPTPDPILQQERKTFIDKQINNGLFYKVEVPGNLPHVWITQKFKNLDFDSKAKFINIVWAYYKTENPSYDIVVLKDSTTGERIGEYAEAYGGLKLK